MQIKYLFFISQEKYMLEVRICLDKRFVAVNCSDANNGMKLLYPKTVSARRIFQSNIRTGACTTCSDQIQNSDLVGRSKYSSLEFSYLWLLLSFCSSQEKNPHFSFCWNATFSDLSVTEMCWMAGTFQWQFS